ncbi:MAG: TraR/DksA C4-type zinc finger protein [Chitinophagaceae bacterium]|nr:TraR/DksA C4-type zinc finger protein [Chitinophagaceae bacterium]
MATKKQSTKSTRATGSKASKSIKRTTLKPVKKSGNKHIAKKIPKSSAKTARPADHKAVAKKATPKKITSRKPSLRRETPSVKKTLSKKVEPVKKPAVSAPSGQQVKHAIKPLSKPAIKPQPAKPVKVVVPKTSTTTSVKYEPEFTKSVLDTQPKQSTGPTMRYSDAELAEFKELISRKLETAKKELTYLQGLITRKDESGELDEGRYMTMEDGSMSMEREQLSQMASRQIQFIDHLEKAMMRIENKTYGICRVTGKLIDKARLRAVPHATLSIEAKQMMNK